MSRYEKCAKNVLWVTIDFLLDAIEHLALQPMLDLPAPDHEVQHLVDGPLRVFLTKEVLHNGVLRDLKQNRNG